MTSDAFAPHSDLYYSMLAVHGNELLYLLLHQRMAGWYENDKLVSITNDKERSFSTSHKINPSLWLFIGSANF